MADTPEQAVEHLRSELDYEILEMRRVLKTGGHAVWRSAAKRPWYIQRFELAGFRVEPIDIREQGKAIDRVNMYASCEYPVRPHVPMLMREQSGGQRRCESRSKSPEFICGIHTVYQALSTVEAMRCRSQWSWYRMPVEPPVDPAKQSLDDELG